jgi:hypothetical protein
MSGTANFRYDVAFSFLDQDEPLARDLSGLLNPLTTFVYSEQQLAVAATDGIETFSNVFRRDARIVVILYRGGWGKTKWTRIEEEAIKSRFLEDGSEFVILVKLDASETPTWFPAARIWVDLTRFGAAGAASVIKVRVSEAGGAVRAETPQENAARLERERAAEAERFAFLRSERGVAAAYEAVERLLTRLEALSSETDVAFDREDLRYALLYRDGFSLAVGWSLSYRNTLDDSALYLTEWQGRPDIGSKRFHSPNRREIAHHQLRFDLAADQTPVWREERQQGRTFTTEGLADYCLNLLLERVRGKLRER